MKKSILTLFLTCNLLILIAQETSTLTINFSPQNIVIRVDGIEVIPLKDKTNPFVIPLSVGSHEIEAWAKGFEIQKFKLDISLREENQLNIGMNKLNPEFQAYLKSQEIYTGNKAKDVGIVGLTTVLIGSSVLLLSQGNNEKNKLYDQLKKAQSEYAGALSASELSVAEQKHSKALKAIKNRRLFGFISGTLAVGASTIAIRHFKKKKTQPKLEQPVYKEVNPFVFYDYEERKNVKFRLGINGIVLNF